MLRLQEGARLKEATSINGSLSSLGQVLAALRKRGTPRRRRRGSSHDVSRHTAHVPFRNSKLTHLLQGSLGELLCFRAHVP